MYTKTEATAKREMAHFKTDLDGTLYTVSGVAFLLGIGRNDMKGLTIPKTKQHGTGKDWIRKSDLVGWLRQLANDPEGEQGQLLKNRQTEYHARCVKKVSTNKLIGRLEAPSSSLGNDLWGHLKESGRPMDDATTDPQQQALRLLYEKYPRIKDEAEGIAQDILGAGLR